MTLIEQYTSEICKTFEILSDEIIKNKNIDASKIDGHTLEDIESRIIRKVILIGLTFFLAQIGLLAIYQIFFSNIQ
jgi:hypothetical protein